MSAYVDVKVGKQAGIQHSTFATTCLRRLQEFFSCHTCLTVVLFLLPCHVHVADGLLNLLISSQVDFRLSNEDIPIRKLRPQVSKCSMLVIWFLVTPHSSRWRSKVDGTLDEMVFIRKGWWFCIRQHVQHVPKHQNIKQSSQALANVCRFVT